MALGRVDENASLLFDDSGRRKYLSVDEWRQFLAATCDQPAAVAGFCRTLAFTGCRISEALALTQSHLDGGTGRIVLRTLKRRKRVFRAVPVPHTLLDELRALGVDSDARIWPWCRQTAWRRVKQVMREAGIDGPQATAKGLRHGFGIAAAEENIPPGLTQRWMGHASMETTSIYQHAVGREERAFAERLWRQ